MKSLTKYIVLPCALALSVVGCAKFEDFGDTNISPNATELASTQALLTNALLNVGSYSSETRGGLYAQHFSETQYTETSLYQAPVLDFTALYYGPIADLDKIIAFCSDPVTAPRTAAYGLPQNQIAISRIVKAFYYWAATDKWGDLPYTEALKAPAIMYPKYDTPETIYKGVMQELTEAVDQLDLSANNVTGDVIAEGASQAASWARFANSLRMVIALRTSNVYSGASEWGAVEFKKAFEHPRGYIVTNAQNFNQKYDGDVVAYGNPWWSLFRTRSDYAVSDVFGEALVNVGDPRVSVVGSNTTFFPYGLTRNDAVAFTSSVGGVYSVIWAPAYRQQSSTVPILTASQVALTIAEAASLGWISADATTWLKNGVTLGWGQYNVGAGLDVDGYLADVTAETGYTGTALIQYQQWFSWYGNGLQAWSNWRRTRVPNLIPSPNALSASGQIPERYQYPTTELNFNEENARLAFAKYNDNSPDVKLWWAK